MNVCMTDRLSHSREPRQRTLTAREHERDRIIEIVRRFFERSILAPNRFGFYETTGLRRTLARAVDAVTRPYGLQRRAEAVEPTEEQREVLIAALAELGGPGGRFTSPESALLARLWRVLWDATDRSSRVDMTVTRIVGTRRSPGGSALYEFDGPPGCCDSCGELPNVAVLAALARTGQLEALGLDRELKRPAHRRARAALRRRLGPKEYEQLVGAQEQETGRGYR